MEISDEESITSGSEYCPSYDDDSDQSEPEPGSETEHQEICSTYDVERTMKIKRKVFFENETETLQRNSIEENHNNNQLESSTKTENLHDDNGAEKRKSNENGINVHVTADDIQPSIKKGKNFELLPKISKKKSTQS